VDIPEGAETRSCSSPVVLDVGHPQLVAAGAGGLTLDQIAGGRLRSQATSELGAAGDALQAGAAHQQLDSVVTDGDAAAQGELGVDPPAAVGLSGGGMTWPMVSVSQAYRIARADGGRLRQA
jgi:hypothetical protein